MTSKKETDAKIDKYFNVIDPHLMLIAQNNDELPELVTALSLALAKSMVLFTPEIVNTVLLAISKAHQDAAADFSAFCVTQDAIRKAGESK